MKVCHITSVHKAFDTRIFYRECISLARAGFDVTLVAPHDSDLEAGPVKIRAVKSSNRGRLFRMVVTTTRVFFKAWTVKADIIHFHDPELFWCGLVFKLAGKKVIFDVHENIAGQIKNKSWLPGRKVISKIYSLFDWLSSRLFFLVLAEDSYQKIYNSAPDRQAVILNMPDLDFFKPYINKNRAENQNEIFYVGGVTFERGIDTLIRALKILKARNVAVTFHCIGPYETEVMEEIKKMQEYEDVRENCLFYNSMKLEDAVKIAMKCKVGVSILKPIENYMESYSTKIFEYMAMGLPFITSDFPLYRKVVETSKAGICIDPFNSEELAEKLKYLLTNREVQMQFSENGLDAVNRVYNWAKEEAKLVAFYKGIARQAKQ